MANPLLVSAREARVYRVFGGDIHLTLPQSAAEAGVSLFDDVRQPGDGPPLHMHHNEDEIFRIIEGRFRFKIGERELEAGPGDTLCLPRDIPHSFVNSGDVAGRVLVVLQPGGFEQFFIDVLEQGLEAPADMEPIARLAARYGLEFLGPNPFTGR